MLAISEQPIPLLNIVTLIRNIASETSNVCTDDLTDDLEVITDAKVSTVSDLRAEGRGMILVVPSVVAM